VPFAVLGEEIPGRADSQVVGHDDSLILSKTTLRCDPSPGWQKAEALRA